MVEGVVVTLSVVLVCTYYFLERRRSKQLEYILAYEFHPTIGLKIKEKYPHLSDENVETVFKALRNYFYFCNQAKKKMVAMPSQVVDVAWHEFILFTKHYETFSKKAIGRFLHHTPTEAMDTPISAKIGLKRVWRLACSNENISPSSPARLPLLFSIDTTLNIENGYKYSINCKDITSPSYNNGDFCGGHIGCTTSCGSGTSCSGGSSCSGGGCGGGGD